MSKIPVERSPKDIETHGELLSQEHIKFPKCFDEKMDEMEDEVDECRDCNLYYEILYKMKEILAGEGGDKSKMKRIQDLVYIARLI